ncbi:MAG: hypothetical protein ABIO86_02605 [Sphingomonas sp.]
MIAIAMPLAPVFAIRTRAAASMALGELDEGARAMAIDAGTRSIKRAIRRIKADM